MGREGGDRGDKVAFTALLVLGWLASAWWALEQAQYIVGVDKTLFVNRMALCLLIYGVFIAYYVWKSFKPAHWILRDHDDYHFYPSTFELPDYWSNNIRRYKEMIRERMRRERNGEAAPP